MLQYYWTPRSPATACMTALKDLQENVSEWMDGPKFASLVGKEFSHRDRSIPQEIIVSIGTGHPWGVWRPLWLAAALEFILSKPTQKIGNKILTYFSPAFAPHRTLDKGVSIQTLKLQAKLLLVKLTLHEPWILPEGIANLVGHCLRRAGIESETHLNG